jgi:phosphoserine aminotransferase
LKKILAKQRIVQMKRIHNFAAGPAALPLEVLQQAQDELLDWQDRGLSLMELGHRTTDFCELIARIEVDLRQLLAIPENYKVLFLAGGARVQFAMIPLNLLAPNQTADYLDTGIWSQMAATEAAKYVNVHCVASGHELAYLGLPDRQQWHLTANAGYVHYTDNETVQGVEFHHIPDVGNVPLVSDMTSSLLSKPLEINRFGLIYAGCQKNLGIAGLTVVIVREDLLGKAQSITPTAYDYQIAMEQQSLYVTPPTYPWYITGLVCAWLKRQGGVAEIAKVNARKAKKLYTVIDNTPLYVNKIDVSCRSRMNVVFNLTDPALEATFLEQAKRADLAYLKGHRLVGGFRASIYNAVPEASVDSLVAFMQDFAKQYG